MDITNPQTAPLYDAGNLREGSDRGTKVLFAGEEGRLDNYRWFYSAPGVGEWRAPRHRHNFEQIRFSLAGRFEYRPGEYLDGGDIIYFPEGVHYGPQLRHEGLSMLTLQYGGASRSGYMSQAQRKRGYQELGTKGKFEKGCYTWTDETGKRHNQDSFEAIWEHMMGREIVYPAPRYGDLIHMSPENFSWGEVAGSPGVSEKCLASLTERGVRVGFLRIDAGETAHVGGLGKATDLMFLMEGELRIDGKEHGSMTAFRCNPGEAAESLTAVESSQLFRIVLPAISGAAPVMAGCDAA